MASNNPAFSRNPVFNGKAPATPTPTITAAGLEKMYDAPAATAAQTGRLSYDDVIIKTALNFVVLVAFAAVGWNVPVLALPAALLGFGLAMVNIFKKQPSPPLILLYSALQGLFIGAISGVFEARYPGVVIQAVLATICVFAVTLVLFAFGKIRASKRATKIFLIAMVGYIVFSLLNVVLMLTGVNSNAFGLSGSVTLLGIPLGVILGVFVTILAAYSLVLDFDQIQRGVKAGAPRNQAWSAAFGLVMTVVWLYLELLRMFAIARN
ncbi:Bax inhibitor-1/YccA family protein [Subtercola frigoramans]|uniref:YccA/Bax inhibitor family protein n=1 Tax=Subtercola frigoramans TaxID=120298 RepID=A0ABS2L2Z4_9MICO|nr:Bax inhibitor-1/YccA family protein [Subtercola frigoramans]MBM7471408.1 putative YccA/Bax inhibitor family protein [Subtercola frigoramans]